MFKVTSRGNYSKTKEDLHRLRNGDNFSDLDNYGQRGVDTLRNATPVDTGLTANSWDYRIVKNGNFIVIEWFNTNRTAHGGPSVAVLIQYGHATRSGSYVSGLDYINPAMRLVFDEIINDLWKKVTA